MLIEIHMLKNYPPTNLNRDDTGSPKSCYFGGVQRGRISSQCLKRSWRLSPTLQDAVGKDCFGIRTRKLPDLVAAELEKLGVDQEFIDVASSKISGFGNKEGKENKDGNYTTQIAFFSPEDIQAVAKLVQREIENAQDLKTFKAMSVKDWQKKLNDVSVRPITLDIALFGRMVTSDAFADVDASMQVAHALSTHRVAMESDFFTAVDDMIGGESNDDLGAGMMGDTDFNSCCYYIYAAIDVDQLKSNLKYAPDAEGLVNKAVPALVEAMTFSNPSGKQNAFAGNARPDAVLVECKERKIAASYANAYVKPVSPHASKDMVEASIDRLAEEVAVFSKDFALAVDTRLWFCNSKYGIDLDGVNRTNCDTFGALIEALGTVLDSDN